MLTRNLWSEKGLVSGAQDTVSDISWADGVVKPRNTLLEVTKGTYLPSRKVLAGPAKSC